MAERRMFAKTIIDSDAFLDMPLSSQSLYFHLSMRADDDGFINNPKKIQRMVGASDDDAKLLRSKKFILSFETGVIVIKHWKIHNYIQKDRYKPTIYQEEKSELGLKGNNGYTMDTPCIQDGSTGKVRLGKVKEDNTQQVAGASDEFEKFWSIYDKKKDRKKALAKWSRLTQSDIQKIFETLPSYIESTADKQFRKDPVTYLNNESWNDEFVPSKNIVQFSNSNQQKASAIPQGIKLLNPGALA